MGIEASKMSNFLTTFPPATYGKKRGVSYFPHFFQMVSASFSRVSASGKPEIWLRPKSVRVTCERSPISISCRMLEAIALGCDAPGSRVDKFVQRPVQLASQTKVVARKLDICMYSCIPSGELSHSNKQWKITIFNGKINPLFLWPFSIANC